MSTETNVTSAKTDLKVLLEGVELPCMSVLCTGGVGSATQAQIAIPYIRELLEIKPRSYVSVEYFLSDNGVSIAADGTLVTEPDVRNFGDWHLLFCGEVSSYSYGSTPDGRQIVLSAVGLWERVASSKVYWAGRSLGHQVMQRAGFAGATRVIPNQHSTSNNIHQLLPQIFSTKPKTAPKSVGVAAGIVSLVEFVSGTMSANTRLASGKSKETEKTSTKGINDYTSFLGARYKLPYMFGVPVNDTTSVIFFGSARWNKYFREISGAVRGTAGVGQLVGAVLERSHYQLAGVLAPPYIPKLDLGTRKVQVIAGRVGYSSDFNALFAALRALQKVARKRLTAVVKKKELGVAKSQVTWTSWDAALKGTHAEITKKADTPSYATDEHLAFNRNVDSTGFPSMVSSSAATLGTDDSLLTRVLKELTNKEASLSTSQESKRSTLRRGVELAQNVWGDSGNLQSIMHRDTSSNAFTRHTLDNLLKLDAAIAAALKALRSGRYNVYKESEEDIEYGDRLHNYLLTPDLYMMPPPTCNVLFPDQVASVKFSRNWDAEVTRVWLHSKWANGVGKRDIFFSPNVTLPGYSNPKKTIQAVEAVRKGHRFIMEHERFYGIVPAIIGADETAAYAKMEKKTKQETRDRAKSALGRAALEEHPYMQRAANYHFYAQRFASRPCEITCKFSPNIVAGLPLLLLDHGLAGGDVLPENARHIIGVVSSITHTISSGHSATNITLSSCRYHDERLDLFNEDGVVTRYKTRKFKRKVLPSAGNVFVVQQPSGEDRYYVDGSVRLRSTLPKSEDVYEIPGTHTALAAESFNDDVASGDELDEHKDRPALFPADSIQPGTPAKTGQSFGLAMNSQQVLPIGPGTKTRKVYTRNVKELADEFGDRRKKTSLFSDAEQTGRPEVLFTMLSDGEVDGYRRSTFVEGIVVDVFEEGTLRRKYSAAYDIEDLLVPPWMDPSFYPANIGEEVYTPLLGCKSILDVPSIELDDDSLSTIDTEATKNANLMVEIQVTKDRSVLAPAALFLKKLSVRDAASHLALAWFNLKAVGADRARYALMYQRRRYASVRDMYNGNMYVRLIEGTLNNWYNTEVGKLRDTLGEVARILKVERVSSITEGSVFQQNNPTPSIGFHADAFGLYENLEKAAGGYLAEDSGNSNKIIDPSIDTRAERYAVALVIQNKLLERAIPSELGGVRDGTRR